MIGVDHRSRVDCVRVRFARDQGGQALPILQQEVYCLLNVKTISGDQ